MDSWELEMKRTSEGRKINPKNNFKVYSLSVSHFVTNNHYLLCIQNSIINIFKDGSGSLTFLLISLLIDFEGEHEII